MSIKIRNITIVLYFMVAAVIYAETVPVYFGTFTSGSRSKGIYRSEFDLETGQLSDPVLAAEADDPTFLVLNRSGSALYAVNLSNYRRGVNAYSINENTSALTFINTQSSAGRNPCHISLDKSGEYVLVANYTGGNASVLPVNKNLGVDKAAYTVADHGKGKDPRRQDGPKVHSIITSPDNRFAFVADLGIDKIMIYSFDVRTGKLTPNNPAFVEVEPGSGPRHMAFHPTAKYAYVINELSSTITAFDYNFKSGELTPIQTISTVPWSFKGTNYPAEIAVHPTGKFLYGSNRGNDSIAVYSISSADGKLKLVEHETDDIVKPINFCIDPTGRFMLVANQDDDSIVVFKIDPRTGGLSETDSKIMIYSPACIRFLIKETVIINPPAYFREESGIRL